MVLPGIQALVGFQLIAVFNERFDQALGEPGKRMHLVAVLLRVLAIGLIMAPAAYHRQAERDGLSHYFASYASLLITLAMAPLVIALAVEVSLVSFLVTHLTLVSTAIGAAVFVFLTWLWYGFPAYRRRYPAGLTKGRRNGSRTST